jgi:hemerythrin superfamily protein
MTATMKNALESTEVVALALLDDDPKKIQKMFKEFGELKPFEDEKKTALLKQICLYLDAHTKAEEKLTYPVVHYDGKHELTEEIDAEQERTIRLIARIEAMRRDDDHYDARVKAIGEYIGHMKSKIAVGCQNSWGQSSSAPKAKCRMRLLLSARSGGLCA